MDDKERISLSIYDLFVSVRDTFSLPTHKTLEKTFYFSIALFVCSVLSELLGFYTFISWQGCIICVALLLILLWMERSENDALSKMYRAARLSAEKTIRRAKAASSSISSKRGSNVNNRRTETTGKREEPGNEQ